jgi:hypothetical protein
MLLSSEEFALLSRAEIRQLRDQLPEADFRVLVYLRQPSAFMSSSYLQRLKNGREHGTFADFVQHNAYLCAYTRLLQDWAAVFGRDALRPRSYDKARHGPGLIVDFLSLLDIDVTALPKTGLGTHWRNRTPSDGMLRCLHALNRAPIWQMLGTPGETGLRALRRTLVLLDRVDDGRTGALLGRRLPTLIDPAGRALAQRLCNEQLDALFDDWLPAEDRAWFEPDA